MPLDLAKPKVTPVQILEDMARLSARRLETVIEQASLLRLQKRRRLMPARESDLLRTINSDLSPEKNASLEQLEQKLREERINPREHRRLLRLTDELERLAAKRLQALIELAALRRTSVPKLMNEMGLGEAAYA